MSSTRINALEGGRLISIDALRGLAALGVVFYHAVQQTPNAVPNNLFRWPVYLIQFGSSFGYVGVFLFFVISGFCIHLQWARAHAEGRPGEIQFGSFWKRRIRRLYPPYLIAFSLYLLVAALTTGINLTHSFVYDVAMHLLMLHNLDPQTCYSINGVFWTLAIEEQLYLAYFLLLFLRNRWGWAPTLATCLLSRVGWYFLARVISAKIGFAVPVAEAAASHWFTWALGAISVEAIFGQVQLPRWCRNIWLGGMILVAATAMTLLLPSLHNLAIHDLCWLLLHPAWGLGFFIVVNRAVLAEQEWFGELRKPRLVVALAWVGIFSYSLYLTHELVVIQSWWFVVSGLAPMLNTLLIVVPATVTFAWLFFRFFERPYMRHRPSRAFAASEQTSDAMLLQRVPTLADGG